MPKRTKGLGTMRKRSDGRWEARFVIGHKNASPIYKSVYAKSQEECEKRLKQAKQNYEYESRIMERCPYFGTPFPTVQEWYEIWIDTFCKNNVKYGTYVNHKNNFRLYILPPLGNKKLKELSTIQCQRWMNGLEQYNLSSGTMKNIKVSLQTCLQKAVDEGTLYSNPMKKVKLKHTAQTEMKTLSSDDLVAFLEAAKKYGLYEFYYLVIATGMRKGEILALTWSDFDENNNTITINKTLSKINGKYLPTSPKTRSSNRTITISKECTDMLINLKKKTFSEIMFPNTKNGYRNPNHETERLHKILHTADLPDIRFHDLRHTFATLALENGMDIKTVSHMLGHTDAGFTMNTYMHVTDTMQSKVANSVSKLIAEKQKELEGGD